LKQFPIDWLDHPRYQNLTRTGLNIVINCLFANALKALEAEARDYGKRYYTSDKRSRGQGKHFGALLAGRTFVK